MKYLNSNDHLFLIMDKGYFPYGKKSKEFLLKRSLYLCDYLIKKGVDEIILACNTLSIVALPFLKLFYNNIRGVFEELIPYINSNSLIISSLTTKNALKEILPNKIINGNKLIYKIENNIDITNDLKILNQIAKNYSNIIFACTHFINIDYPFNIPIYKNMNKHNNL